MTEVRRRIGELYPAMLALALQLARDLALAEDICQGACVRALAAEDQYSEGTKLKSWLFSIVQSEWIDYCRYENRRPTDLLEDVEQVAAIDKGADIRMRSLEVERALAQLPVSYRKILLLCSVNGVPLPKVARHLNLPKSTVKAVIERAQEQLRLIIEINKSEHHDYP